MNRTYNSFRNAIFGLLSNITTLVIPFILRSILIFVLGEEYLGLNNLFHSLITVLTVVDLGFSAVISQNMYKPIADNNDDEVCRLLNLYKKIYVVIGLLILIFGLSLLPFLDNFINGEYSNDINIRLIYIVYLSETVINYLFFAHKTALLNALQRNDIVSKVTTLVNLFFYIIRIIVLIYSKNYYLYIVFLPITAFIIKIVISIVCKIRYPKYICKGKTNKKENIKIFKNTIAISIKNIGYTINNSLGTIIVSSYLGLTETAIYSNYLYIVSSLQSILSVIITSVQASVGNSLSIDSNESSINILKSICYINSWLIVCFCSCSFCLYQNFMNIWMHGKLLGNNQLVVLMVLYLFISCIRYPLTIYINAAGLWDKDKYKSIVSAIVGSLSLLILIKKYGILTPVIALIISLVLVELPWEMYIVIRTYFNRSIKTYVKGLVNDFIITMLSTLLCYLFCLLLSNQTSIIIFIIKGFACFLIATIVYFLCTRNSINYNLTKNRITNIANKIKAKN